jgi:hypothetical protein
MTTVQIVLAVAALPIGLTGAWSPCGFSMVETVGVRGDPGAGRTTLAACAAFVPGAALGGVVTFGALAALGGLVHGVGGRATFVVAAAIAVAGAVLEARGVRIVPQIRRQLPEGWRWRMPLPLASCLYGILLGLGFTTFVLSFGVWALAAISFALGNVTTGVAVGLAFGVGRALPVVFLAPLADHPVGIRCMELMAERPSLYRHARLGDAAALVLTAGALVVTAPGANAAHVVSVSGADPSVARHVLAYQRASGKAAVRSHGRIVRYQAKEPAVGGRWLAMKKPGRIVIRGVHSGRRAAVLGANGVDAIAISGKWIVLGQSTGGRDFLKAARLTATGHPGRLRVVAHASHPVRIGHPSLDGGTAAFALSGPGRSRIFLLSLHSGRAHAALGARRALLSNPSIRGKRLLFVRAIRARESPQATEAPPLNQRLVLSRLDGRHRQTLFKQRDEDTTLWTTALSTKDAYVTILNGHRSKIIRVSR